MRQLIRFCLVGCSNVVLSYSVFFLCYHYFPLSAIFAALPSDLADALIAGMRRLGLVSLDASMANVIGFTAGMGNSFFWNKRWTFRSLERTHVQAHRFIVTNLLCLVISTGCMLVGADLKQLPYPLVWGATMAGVTGINFLLSRYWVFA